MVLITTIKGGATQVTNNQPFADLSALSEAVVKWFEKLSFSQFCSLMGISDTAPSTL